MNANRIDKKIPYVTIVVPAYNAERWIDACLRSISSQTYLNIQVILVNDGSTDNTPSLCEDWCHHDLRFQVIHQSNAGLPAARNSGLKYAEGKWILFVDSDDLLDSQTIASLVSVGDSTDADIVSYGWKTINEKGKVLHETVPCSLPPGDQQGLIREVVEGRLGDYVWSYFFRTAALVSAGTQSGPFVEGRTLFEDALFLHRMLRTGSYRVAYLPKALYQYRQVNASMSRGNNPLAARDGLDAVQELRALGAPNGLSDAWNAKLAYMLFFCTDCLAGSGWFDGQAALHRSIRLETGELVGNGGWRAFNIRQRVKYLFYRARLLGLIRYIKSHLSR